MRKEPPDILAEEKHGGIGQSILVVAFHDELTGMEHLFVCLMNGLDLFPVGVEQFRGENLHRCIWTDFFLIVGYAFLILQLPDFFHRELAGFVTDSKIDFILGGGDDFVDGRLDVQQDQPVRLPSIVRYVHELVTVFRHRNAAALWKIEEIVDLLFALGIDTFYSPGLVADATFFRNF